MAGKPSVYIITLTWNHRDVTSAFLRSISAIDYPAVQTILVDNASCDGTADYVRREFPSVTVIENERNLGFAAGCNVGIRHALEAGADYVFLLNNDTQVEANVVSALVSWAEAHPHDGLLTPLIRYADEGDQVWFAGSRRGRLTLDSENFGPGRPERVPIQHSREVDYVMGCAMFIRVEALRQVGLFDETFFMYHEDMDLSLRVQNAGYTLRYVPDACVRHLVEISTSDAPPLRYYYKARSSVRFYRKHVHGLHWAVIIPYRIGSAVKKVVSLVLTRQTAAMRAYVRGLWDGWRKDYRSEFVLEGVDGGEAKCS
jgi:GT2 family glycosyltransferase